MHASQRNIRLNTATNNVMQRQIRQTTCRLTEIPAPAWSGAKGYFTPRMLVAGYL